MYHAALDWFIHHHSPHLACPPCATRRTPPLPFTMPTLALRAIRSFGYNHSRLLYFVGFTVTGRYRTAYRVPPTPVISPSYTTTHYLTPISSYACVPLPHMVGPHLYLLHTFWVGSAFLPYLHPALHTAGRVYAIPATCVRAAAPWRRLTRLSIVGAQYNVPRRRTGSAHDCTARACPA